MAMAMAPPVQIPVKPWWKSTTVLFAGAAGIAATVSGLAQDGYLNGLFPAAVVQGIGLVCDGIALLGSGGAIHGRFAARMLLK